MPPSSAEALELTHALNGDAFRASGGRNFGADGSEAWSEDYIYCNGWDLANSVDPSLHYPVVVTTGKVARHLVEYAAGWECERMAE
jgi:hypothetical protein